MKLFREFSIQLLLLSKILLKPNGGQENAENMFSWFDVISILAISYYVDD